MPGFTLTDLGSAPAATDFRVDAARLGLASDHPWSVTRATLRGGRRDGVELIHLDNGALSVTLIPTRGMGIWKGSYRGAPLGWGSPVVDGPVHPRHVHQLDHGGLGWLEGFDELMVRCGLGHNGPPYEVAVPGPDGSTARHVLHGLHGRIANMPAYQVSVHVDDAAPHAITVEGKVAESALFLTQVEMTTRVTTVPGSNRLVVRDHLANLSDLPAELQLLYHWNLGPPFLGEGATFHAPVAALSPRDPRAAEGLDAWRTYEKPQAGFAEQAYLAHLLGKSGGRTLAMLKSPDGAGAVVLRFDLGQLPCFTLWKNTAGLRDGYVTGLEPATNFPNPKPFEKARGRVVALPPGGTYLAETILEVLDDPEAIREVEREIAAIQSQATPTIHPRPVEPFAAEG